MRIEGVDLQQTGGDLARIFEAQISRLGQALPSSRLMARRPSIFLGHQALAAGLDASGLLPRALAALINRRVASHNGCPF